jgi:hypothetical protein
MTDPIRAHVSKDGFTVTVPAGIPRDVYQNIWFAVAIFAKNHVEVVYTNDDGETFTLEKE